MPDPEVSKLFTLLLPISDRRLLEQEAGRRGVSTGELIRLELRPLLTRLRRRLPRE